jgi:hypothetical protein
MPVRFLTPAEVPDLTPVNVQEEQGVSGFERFVVKNLTSSPESARAFLEKRGYQTRKWGDGWNFAVRKRDGDPWKVVDPRGLDAWDITDLIGDVGVGLLSGATATLGAGAGAAAGPGGFVAGGVAGGTAGGALGETARQGLGKLAGVPDNVDPSQIAMSGAIGGAFPAMGGLLGATGRGLARATNSSFGEAVGEQLSNLGAMVAGTGSLGNTMSRGEVLASRARIPQEKLPSVEGVAKRLNSVVNRLWNKGQAHITELDQAEKMAQLAHEQGVRVDARAAIENLDRFTPKPGAPKPVTTIKQAATTTTARTTKAVEGVSGGTVERRGLRTNLLEEPPTPTEFASKVEETRSIRGDAAASTTTTRDVTTARTTLESEDVLAKEAAELAISEPSLPKTIQGVVGRIKTLIGDEDLSALSPVTATKIKRQLQKIGFSKGAFENEPIGDAFTRLIATASHDLRTATERAMEDAGFGSYSKLMEIGSTRFGYLKDMYEVAGRDPDQALKYVQGVYGGNFRLQTLRDFEKNMGIPANGLSKAIEQARIGEVAFGPGRRGKAPLLPRFTAVGTLFGAGLAANQLGIDIGPMTPLIGVALASPRSILALTRLGQKFGGPAVIRRLPPSQAGELVKETIKILSLSAAQGSGRRVLSQDSQGRRRAVFVGE